MTIEERFNAFKNANFFSRVDNTHILELHIGLDDKNRKAIELRANFIPRKLTGTTAIIVNQYRRPEYNTIRFSLCDEEISGLFFKFCDDLIEQTADIKDKSQGYQAIVNRFFQWKKLFVTSKGRLLTESEIMGLCGEILFLKLDLSKRLGWSQALRSWSGQELTHKDFSFENTWCEVKALHRGASAVRIASLEQLDSEYEGELIVCSLEKMSTAYKGITLNKLIIETKNTISSVEDQDGFMTKVALQGYEYNDYYDDYVYEVASITRFRVNEDFPKLTHKILPKAILKATYELSLMEISTYIIDTIGG